PPRRPGRAHKVTSPILNTEKQGSVRRNRSRNGLAKRAPSARASPSHFARWRRLAGGEKAVCATFWSRSTARTRRDTEVHLSHFFIPCYGLSKTSTIFEIGDTRFFSIFAAPPPPPPPPSFSGCLAAQS